MKKPLAWQKMGLLRAPSGKTSHWERPDNGVAKADFNRAMIRTV